MTGSDHSLKGKIEAIIYAAEEPVTMAQMVAALGDSAGEGEERALAAAVRAAVEELAADCAADGRGLEITQVAGGFRMATKAEHHEVVRAFARSLKPPIRLSLPALETLAVIAYRQPATAPEISEIRGVDSSAVLATLLERKLITTAGRKAVIGRPILYKTTREFLLRFGLNDLTELPSVEEFEKLAGAAGAQPDLFSAAALPDATGTPQTEPVAEAAAEPQPASN